MKRNGLRNNIILILLAAALGSGCGSEGNGERNQEDFASRLSVPVPVVTPTILVDQNGYRTGAEKAVFFEGDKNSREFEVRRTEDDAVVFTGGIRDGRQGTFTDFQTEGSYYIYTEEAGASYAFRIGADICETEIHDALRMLYRARCGTELTEKSTGTEDREACHTVQAGVHSEPSLTIDVTGGWHTEENGTRDVLTVCDTLRDLLLAYEMNPDHFDDAAGLPESGNGIPDILDEACTAVRWLQKMQTGRGGVYAGVESRGESGNGNLTVSDDSAEATAAFAGVMARFSFLYEAHDAAFAAECLENAKSAWTWYSVEKSVMREKDAFSAASELYRMTGEKKYESVLASFFGREDFAQLFLTDDEIFYGGITYLSTTQPVNVEVCEHIMQTLLADAEEIARLSKVSPWLVVAPEADDGGYAPLLDAMRRLCVTDHIIYNHEYTTIIENHIHYLSGRNPECLNYISETTEYTYLDAGKTGLVQALPQTAMLLLMLGTIA